VPRPKKGCYGVLAFFASVWPAGHVRPGHPHAGRRNIPRRLGGAWRSRMRDWATLVAREA
jgi:hypothetical protein